MNRALHLNRYLISFGIPLGLLGVLVLIMRSPLLAWNNTLTLAVTFDLILTIPIIYFLLIRKTAIPKTTVIPFIVMGLIIGTYFLPKDSQGYLNLFKTWALPIIELSILTLVVIKFRRALKKYKDLKDSTPDFFSTLKSTCYEMLPKYAVMPVVTEIAVFYYGFIHWKRKTIKENEFTYHKDSGIVALMLVAIFIIAIETVVLHILVVKWSSTVAWILTFLSIYSVIQLFGFLRSMFKRPISIANNKLILRYGIMSESTIDLSEIESVEISSKDIAFHKEIRKLSLLGELESHNVILKLKKENTLIGLYGRKRTFKVLALHVDDKMRFKDQIDSALQTKL